MNKPNTKSYNSGKIQFIKSNQTKNNEVKIADSILLNLFMKSATYLKSPGTEKYVEVFKLQ